MSVNIPHDVVLDTVAEVACPYCGETVVIGLDPGGGAGQEYVEDCQVCCRPWRVRVYWSTEVFSKSKAVELFAVNGRSIKACM